MEGVSNPSNYQQKWVIHLCNTGTFPFSFFLFFSPWIQASSETGCFLCEWLKLTTSVRYTKYAKRYLILVGFRSVGPNRSRRFALHILLKYMVSKISKKIAFNNTSHLLIVTITKPVVRKKHRKLKEFSDKPWTPPVAHRQSGDHEQHGGHIEYDGIVVGSEKQERGFLGDRGGSSL